MTAQATMSAVRAQRFGPPGALEFIQTAKPQADAGQVLIRVESAAVNYSDVMRRRASTYPFPTSLPYVPGSEVAGRVESLGPELARIVVRALPDEPEAAALLALMLCAETRRPARVDERGRFVPLQHHDVSRWDAAKIDRAESLLRLAAARATFGRYQLEAAISSCHVARLRDGVDNDREVALLYRTLHATHPSVGAWLGLCAAVARTRGPHPALHALLREDAPKLHGHQPYWALRAELHHQCADPDAARAAYDRALALTGDPAVRAWLERRKTELEQAAAELPRSSP